MQSVHVVVKFIVTICTLIYENGNFLLNKVYELTHLQALRFNTIMPTVIEVFGFVFVSQALTCWAELGFEPVCSKFDYEEKLLAKTMGLENRIDEIGERVTRIESLLEAQQEKKSKLTLLLLLCCFVHIFCFDQCVN